MSEFEFISVFVSIVLAFAMAELLMGWGRLIRAQGDVHHPFFFLGWSVWLLLLMCLPCLIRPCQLLSDSLPCLTLSLARLWLLLLSPPV